MNNRKPARQQPSRAPGATGDTRITAGDVLDPRNAPLWLGVGVLRLLATLPFHAQLRIGAALGRLAFRFAPGRRHVAATNLRLCLPELDEHTRERMLRAHFEALGMSLPEMAMTWWRPRSWFASRCRIEGREHVDAALAGGRGILMLTPHYTAMEVAGLGATETVPMYANFDPPKNRLFSKLLQRGRRRHVEDLLDHRDLRGIVRTLRRNEIMFFAPDQTVRRKYASIAAPFFGIPTLTTTGTSRLARLTGAPVMTMLLLREPDRSGYIVRFLPPLDNFPTDDVEADTARVNEHIAECIRQNAPEQYFWIHQRFKRGTNPRQENPYRPGNEAAAEPKRPPPKYRRMSTLLAPAFAAHTVTRALRDGGRNYLAQRYGRGYGPLPRAALWLHAASVGEVVTAAPLLRAWAARHDEPIVLTTNTPTGYRVARERLPEVHVAWLPVDRPRPVRRFLDHLRPRAALVMETELWPWLFAELRNLQVPTIIVNGRLSARSLQAPGWVREGSRYCLRRARAILARSPADAASFQNLGAAAKRIQVVGNLKFAATGNDNGPGIALPRPHVLAASTHGDEEVRLARAWLAADTGEHLLVIAPRHPERGRRIARAIAALGARVARRSRGEPVTAETDIYIADTLGELPGLMRQAGVVFMGGSLVPRGGQNLIEPARLERAIVAGPHMENFRDETQRLEAAGALRRADNADGAVSAILALLADEDLRVDTGRRAGELVRSEADIAERYVQSIEAVLAHPRGRVTADDNPPAAPPSRRH